MPAFMKYDSTLSAPFEVKPHDWETLVNQNWLLTQYPGALGGKIGWTISSEATYVGLARRNGVTLIVTIMHCTPLQEITSAVQLLNWGFAMNGKVNPVGVLVPPLPVVTAAHARAVHATLARHPEAQGTGSGWSEPARYALFGGAIALAGLGIGLLRRRAGLLRHRGLAEPGHPYPRPGRQHAATWGPAAGPQTAPGRFCWRNGQDEDELELDPDLTSGLGRVSRRAGRGSLTGSVVSLESVTGSAVLRSRAETTVNRPIASPARNTITTPRPMKKPICSSTIRVAPPAGVPAEGRLVQRDATRPPTANQAPPAAASHAASTATRRCLLISTKTPPTNTAAPGSSSSQSRPEV